MTSSAGAFTAAPSMEVGSDDRSRKADLFLYNLRYATIVECRPTTQFSEILDVVRNTGIEEGAFIRHFEDRSAQAALNGDFDLRRSLGVRGLSAYLFEYKSRRRLANGVLDYAAFFSAIEHVTEGELKAIAPEVSLEAVSDLIDRHPLISPIEVREAYGLRDVEEVRVLVQPLLDAGRASITEVHNGWLIRKM